jgi:hypothetical protein
MAGTGRNDRCPCGSGAKVKHCCGQRRGPSDAELARARLQEEANRAARGLLAYDDDEIHEFWRQVLELPTLHHSMLVRLPRLVVPEIERLRHAIQRDDLDGINEALPDALAYCDTPTARVVLQTAALDLAARGRISREVALTAAVDLAQPVSSLMRSSVVEAVCIEGGATRTAGGLLVAAR